MFGAVLVWLILGPFAIFAPLGYIDPWYYPGYFRDFSYLLLHRGFTYYVSRLPWIVPGRIAFSILNPELASLLLCACIVTVSAFCLYSMVRWYYGRTPAILAALALITNAYFMGAAGWPYPDGAAIAYAMVALALNLRPQGSRGWNGFWAAAALTLSACTNLAAGPMIASVLVVPIWRWRHSRKELLRQALCAVAGVAITTLVLSVVSKRMLGDARVFQPQFDMMMYTVRHPGYLSGRYGSGPGFLLSSVRVFMPVFLLALGPALLTLGRKLSPIARPAYLALLTCFSLYMFQELALGRPSLRVHYVSSYIMVVVAGFAGVVVGELWNSVKTSRMSETAAALSLGAVAVVVPYLCQLWGPMANYPGFVWGLLAAIGLAAIVLAILVRRLQSPVQYVALALVLLGISISPAMDLQITWGIDQESLHGTNLSGRSRATGFQCLTKLQDYIKSNLKMEQDVAFWWDGDEPLTNLYASTASIFVSKYLDLTKEMQANSGRLYPGNTTVVHLTEYPELLAERRRILNARGLDVTNERRVGMSYAGQQFIVVMQDLTELKGLP